MPAYTSPGFLVNFLFSLGFSASLRWRVAERVDAAWLAMQPRIRRARAPRVVVGCGAVSAIRRCSGTAPPAPQLWPRSGCRPVDQLDLEGRRFVDHACPTKYACIAVANSSAESPARFGGQLCHGCADAVAGICRRRRAQVGSQHQLETRRITRQPVSASKPNLPVFQWNSQHFQCATPISAHSSTTPPIPRAARQRKSRDQPAAAMGYPRRQCCTP